MTHYDHSDIMIVGPEGVRRGSGPRGEPEIGGSEMNNVRRKNIEKVIGMISDARSLLEELMEEEEEYRDNMPENLQGSERYEKADEACYNMEEAIGNLEDIESTLEEVIS